MSTSFYLWCVVQFLHLCFFQSHQSPPNYNVYNPPETSFTCEGKVVGGYYADTEASCQLFHICVQIDETQVQDFRFLCPNDTLFDQENFVCADWRDVNCSRALQFYEKNLELFKPTEDEVDRAQQRFDDINQKRRKRQMLEAPLEPNEPMAQTNFTCENKLSGGYHSDIETDCQVFHLCKFEEHTGQWIHKRFRCLNETVFDQQRLICRSRQHVPCSEAVQFYNSTISRNIAKIHDELQNNETTFDNSDETYSDEIANGANDDDIGDISFNVTSNKPFEEEYNITNDPVLKVFNLSALTLEMIDDYSDRDFDTTN